MQTTALLVVVGGLAAGATLHAAPAASAAGGVYGGTTAAREAIVLKTDRAGRQLRSAVLAVVARCDDGRTYPVSAAVTAVRPSPGFAPGPDDLLMGRSRAPRFAGTVLMTHSLGDGAFTGGVSVELNGRLRPRSASGRLKASAVVVDTATGEKVANCTSGPVRWAASRSAGRIYGGTTSQGEPFVARLDARRRTVQDVLVGWNSLRCSPDGGLRVGDAFANFRVDRGGRWGAAWTDEEDLDSGGHAAVSYELRGTLRRSSARGTLAVTVQRHDAAGTKDLSCRTGTIAWTASTG